LNTRDLKNKKTKIKMPEIFDVSKIKTSKETKPIQDILPDFSKQNVIAEKSVKKEKPKISTEDLIENVLEETERKNKARKTSDEFINEVKDKREIKKEPQEKKQKTVQDLIDEARKIDEEKDAQNP